MRRGEGEATFTADGQEWHLRFDFNAMADFEIATGKNAMAALAAMEGDSISAVDVRALFWAALKSHHPDITIEQAGRMVLSGMQAFQAAAASAMPEAEADSTEALPGKAKAADSRAA